jgi:hypothetical protein
MYGYYYPFYRSPYVGPYWSTQPFYPYYNSSFNAVNSQFANQSIVNTGTATGINQIFSPTQIY